LQDSPRHFALEFSADFDDLAWMMLEIAPPGVSFIVAGSSAPCGFRRRRPVVDPVAGLSPWTNRP